MGELSLRQRAIAYAQRKKFPFVIPAKAGIQERFLETAVLLDSRFHGNDGVKKYVTVIA